MTKLNTDKPTTLVIIRRDIIESAGEAASVIAKASVEWLRLRIKDSLEKDNLGFNANCDFGTYEVDWLNDDDPCIRVHAANNEEHLLSVENKAYSEGLFHQADWFYIRNEEGIVAIGFVPLPADCVKRLAKKYRTFDWDMRKDGSYATKTP